MPVTSASPLRYPGGKSVFANFFNSYISTNEIDDPIYLEPYCGGAGAALSLLFEDKVSEIWLNDANYSIYSFWYSLKYYGTDFLELFDNIPVTLDVWIVQKEIMSSTNNKTMSKVDLLSNGFATFFINRCNRSGILNAGPIGGNSIEAQEAANYKIDARFNKIPLRRKLTDVIDRRESIQVFNLDALAFLDLLSGAPQEQQQRAFVYLDPPYYTQGSTLYLNYYNHDDHAQIANYLNGDHIWKWLLSYDNVSQIRGLYKDLDQYSFYINYSAQEAKLGNELLIHCQNSELPESLIIKRISKSNKVIELEKIPEVLIKAS